MCFSIQQNQNAIVKIAKKDIVCYKLLTELDGFYRSPIQNVVYFSIKGKWVIKTETQFTGEKCSIYRGLHAYSSKEEAFAWKTSYGRVFKGIIPKGTPYYYNSYDKQYVALKLKVFNEIVKR